MQNFRAAIILTLIVSALAAAGCASEAGGNTAADTSAAAPTMSADNSNSAKDNTEELGMLVRLPLEPQEVTWKEIPADEKAGAPKRLVAVLRYSDQDAARIVDQAAAHRAPAVQKFPAEPWYPAELVSQGDLSGESTLQGTSYAPDDMLLPPYNEGTLTRIENTNYFVLDVAAR